MVIRFHPSSARHSIGQERARFVIEHCLCPLFPPDLDATDRVVFLGPDPNGIPLEVVGVELEDGDLLVIHVMRLRKVHWAEYARVVACQAL